MKKETSRRNEGGLKVWFIQGLVYSCNNSKGEEVGSWFSKANAMNDVDSAVRATAPALGDEERVRDRALSELSRT